MEQEFQNVFLLILHWLYQQPFVKEEEDGVDVFFHRFPVTIVLPCVLKVKKSVEPYILCVVIVLTCLPAKSAGKIALADSGRSGDEDVVAVRDVFTV